MSFRTACGHLGITEEGLKKLIEEGHIRWKRPNNVHGGEAVWRDDVYLLAFGTDPGPQWNPGEGLAVPISEKPFLIRLKLAWQILLGNWRPR